MSEADNEAASLTLLATAIVVGLTGFFLAYYAVVFQVLWGWFVVPLGARAITWPWAIGLMSVIALVQPIKKDAPLNLSRWVDLFLKPLIILAIGGIAKVAMQ